MYYQLGSQPASYQILEDLLALTNADDGESRKEAQKQNAEHDAQHGRLGVVRGEQSANGQVVVNALCHAEY
jgi:hypothetical protein